VLVAIDGEAGLEAAKTMSPDLILMDMSLPGLDGWEATRLLKAEPAYKSIPIIALTAHAMASDRDKAIQAGCDDYDTKPVEINRLLAKIEKWLSTLPAVAPPIAATPAAAPVEEAAPPLTAPPAPIASGKVLIVEDNEMNRDMLSRRLTRRGYEVVIAIDGEQGVSAAKAHKPDLILMDMSLPGLNGWEATKLIRADESTRKIPIIALTAHAMAADREKAIESGCDDYDTKPVEINRLLGKIDKLISRA
jgi:CheY-like chemotaxis protein